MTAFTAVSEVIRAVDRGETSIGVLPMPRAGEEDPWWASLLSCTKDPPQIVARLPFAPLGNARTNGAEALAIGRGVLQESGHDRTVLALEFATEVSRALILKLLSARGLACTCFASCQRPDGPVDLIEIEGFVPIADPRLESFRTELGPALRRVVPLGGYAVPLAMNAKG